MCLAILVTPGNQIPSKYLRHGWDNNPDGGGYAYIDASMKLVTKQFMHYADFRNAFDRDFLANGKESPFIVHFRWATSGAMDKTNVHPFVVDEHTAMAHNGTIDVVCSHQDKRSDTRIFVEEVARRLPGDWLDHPNMVRMVEDYIGWSKLVFLSTSPQLRWSWYILNERAGHWVGKANRGIWYSNDSYKPRVVKSTKGVTQTLSFSINGKEVAYEYANGKYVEKSIKDERCIICDTMLDNPLVCLECELCEYCAVDLCNCLDSWDWASECEADEIAVDSNLQLLPGKSIHEMSDVELAILDQM